MKKILAVLLIGCVLLTLVSCKTKKADETAVTITEKNSEPSTAPTDDTPKVTVKTDTVTIKQGAPLKTKPEPEKTDDDDALESVLRIEDYGDYALEPVLRPEDYIYSEYEVIIAVKDYKNYKLSDFPEADAFTMHMRNGYFTNNYNPDLAEKRVYGLLLNEPSRENAFQTAKKLMENPYVEYAEPSIDLISDEYFYAVLEDDAAEYIYAKEDFPTLDIVLDNGEEHYLEAKAEYDAKVANREDGFYCSVGEYVPSFRYTKYEGRRVIRMRPEEKSVAALYQQMKLALEDEKIADVIPLYLAFEETDTVVLYVNAEYCKGEGTLTEYPYFTIDYFPYIDGKIINVDYFDDYRQVFIEVKDSTKENLVWLLSLADQDPRIRSYDYNTKKIDYVEKYLVDNEIIYIYPAVDY